jgi:hypothetical protein
MPPLGEVEEEEEVVVVALVVVVAPPLLLDLLLLLVLLALLLALALHLNHFNKLPLEFEQSRISRPFVDKAKICLPRQWRRR